ncbi:MAG TPA: FAD-dependent oxidoreductase [Planctomycetes bacterium]|nr:FAD-dependent oxidoreductase [Planctomycetota bacterium]
MRKTIPLLALLITLALQVPARAQHEHCDVVIYGGTSAAIIAAVQVRKMGKTVIVVSPDTHLGGLSASGLGWTDGGDKRAIGGLSRRFYQRIQKHYAEPQAWRQQTAAQYRHYRPESDAMWVFEPHVAEKVFEQLVADDRGRPLPVRSTSTGPRG